MGDFAEIIENHLVFNLEEHGVGACSPYAHSYVLSEEQLRFWDEQGYLVVKNALCKEQYTHAHLSLLAEEVAALPQGERYPWLVHHEEGPNGEANICRVENFCKAHQTWGALSNGLLQDLVSQCFREPSVLFKDKLNFKGPGGGAFLTHQDATAYATDKLATRHISVMVAVDEATLANGPLQVAPGRHLEGFFPHSRGVVEKEVEDAMEFIPVMVQPGDVVLFDSYLPHRSNANKSDGWRRLVYLTYNKRAEGDLHAAYYEEKHRCDSIRCSFFSSSSTPLSTIIEPSRRAARAPFQSTTTSAGQS
jgi:hypothetical protein